MCKSQFATHSLEGFLPLVLSHSNKPLRNVKRADIPDEFRCYSTLIGVDEASLHIRKRMPVEHQALLHSLVVDSMKVAYVGNFVCCRLTLPMFVLFSILKYF